MEISTLQIIAIFLFSCIAGMGSVLVTKWTSINVPLVVSQTHAADGSTVTMTVQNILDQLCPGLLALGLTLLMVRLLNKKINPVWLIFALFGLGIIGNALGFLS